MRLSKYINVGPFGVSPREIIVQTLVIQSGLKGTLETAAASLCAAGMASEGRDRFASINETSVNNLWNTTSYQHAKPGVEKGRIR